MQLNSNCGVEELAATKYTQLASQHPHIMPCNVGTL